LNTASSILCKPTLTVWAVIKKLCGLLILQT
jgi:hypothetical protein